MVSKKIYKIVCDFSIFLKINSTLAIKMDMSHFEFFFFSLKKKLKPKSFLYFFDKRACSDLFAYLIILSDVSSISVQNYNLTAVPTLTTHQTCLRELER